MSPPPPLPLPPPTTISGATKAQLQKICCDLCHWQKESLGFPGAQPVSFDRKHLDILRRDEYYACEKTDGVRYMMLLLKQGVYMVDRMFDFFPVKIYCPMPREPGTVHNGTLLDGELVCDKEGDKWEWRYYIYDMVTLCGHSVANETLPERLRHVRNFVLTPREKHRPPSPEPFTVILKNFFFVSHIPYIFDTIIPVLPHKNDGIIFTKVHQPYALGTDHTLLKWKPASLNTVDFQVEVKWRLREPWFALLVAASRAVEFFDFITFSKEDQAAYIKNPDLIQNKIIECVFDPEWDHYVPPPDSLDARWAGGHYKKGGWKFLRFREDKNSANDKSVIEKIKRSIADDVKEESLLQVAAYIADQQRKLRPNGNNGTTTANEKRPRTSEANGREYSPAGTGQSNGPQGGSQSERSPQPDDGDADDLEWEIERQLEEEEDDEPSFTDGPARGDTPAYGGEPSFTDVPSFTDGSSYRQEPSFND